MELIYVQEGSAANLLNTIKLIKTKLIRCNWYQQGGSAANLYENVWGKVFSLPDSTQLYPAHDYKGLLLIVSGDFLKR